MGYLLRTFSTTLICALIPECLYRKLISVTHIVAMTSPEIDDKCQKYTNVKEINECLQILGEV